eukprot:SAG22_NODE_3662_length_1586_cov_56110.862811_2_plen_60_part_00
MTTPLETAPAVDAVTNAITARSLLIHLKDNRIEYLLMIGLAHVLGVSDRILTQVTGICF